MFKIKFVKDVLFFVVFFLDSFCTYRDEAFLRYGFEIWFCAWGNKCCCCCWGDSFNCGDGWWWYCCCGWRLTMMLPGPPTTPTPPPLLPTKLPTGYSSILGLLNVFTCAFRSLMYLCVSVVGMFKALHDVCSKCIFIGILWWMVKRH